MGRESNLDIVMQSKPHANYNEKIVGNQCMLWSFNYGNHRVGLQERGLYDGCE